jgi:membrane-bound ClpP family serine protease
LVAFFAIGGWTGLALADISTGLSIAGALLSGTLALVAMAFLMRAIMQLRSSGNIDNAKAIGKIADVYLTIPAKGNGAGKINLTLEERFVEINAIQEGSEPISTGAKVKVTAIVGDTLVVEKI